MALLDPTKLADWQVAEAAEKSMKAVYQLRDELDGEEELLPHGHYVGKVDFAKAPRGLKTNRTENT